MAAAVAVVTPKKRARFLAALAELGVVTYAAAAAGFSRRTAQRLREVDADFADAWDDALEQAADKLEQEAHRRASRGVARPLTSVKGLIYDEDGTIVTEQVYSDTLLIFLLKGMRPEKYRERFETKHSGTVNVRHVVQQIQTALDAALPDDPAVRERVADALLALDERVEGAK